MTRAHRRLDELGQRELGREGVGVLEPAGDYVMASPVRQGDGEGCERSDRARHPYPSSRQIEERLVVPEADRGYAAQAEPPEPSAGIELVGAQRPDRGPQRRHTV